MQNLLRRLISPRPQALERDLVTLTLEGRQIDIKRVRDPRAKRIKLSVDERGARLTLPARASLVSGDRFVQEHRQWLLAQLEIHTRHYTLPLLVRDITGALPLRGESVPLLWHEGRYARLSCSDQVLHLHAPARASDAMRLPGAAASNTAS